MSNVRIRLNCYFHALPVQTSEAIRVPSRPLMIPTSLNVTIIALFLWRQRLRAG